MKLFRNLSLVFIIMLSGIMFCGCGSISWGNFESSRTQFYVGDEFDFNGSVEIGYSLLEIEMGMSNLRVTEIVPTATKTHYIDDVVYIDYSEYNSNAPGTYTIYLKSTTVSESLDSFAVTVSLRENSWTAMPAIDDWIIGQTPASPTGTATAGTPVFEYKLASSADSTYSQTIPTEIGNYTMRAKVELFGYEPLVYTCDFSIFSADAASELNIHFLELGNGYTGDSVYIQVGDVDIIVDGGSRKGSVHTIYDYVSEKMTDDTIEYVIVTHADQDHIAAFSGTSNTNPSLFTLFDVEVIIDFPLTDKDTQVYNDYVANREAEVLAGATHYTALECWNNVNGASRTYDLAPNVELEFLYNYYYEHNSGDENNYSVCFQINQGNKKFLFTGDLEEHGEEYLVEYNQLSQVELFKAGHHGSKTSSNECLLDVIQPKICVVTCVAGSVEYSGKNATDELTYGSADYKDFMKNTFPTQDFINRISEHTDKVYVTSIATVEYNTTDGKYKDEDHASMNGVIVVNSKLAEEVTVNCSNNNIKLKDTQWFADNRVTPNAWANAS